MRLHYFDRPRPDADDVDLYAACVMGHVPEGCLLGGRIVWHLIQSGVKPCDNCGGPRERCGGTPRPDATALGRDPYFTDLLTLRLPE